MSPPSHKAARAELDVLAILLKSKLEVGTNRRVFHRYVESFYGKDAFKLLLSTGAVPSHEKARQALSSLLKRGVVERVDATRPLFNGVVEKFNVKVAQKREDSKRARVNSAKGVRRASSSHLYRFDLSAFATRVLVVRVVEGFDLRRPSANSLSSSSSRAAARSRQSLRNLLSNAPGSNNTMNEFAVDPIVKLRFGSRQRSTTSVHCESNNPFFDERFSFLVDDDPSANKDLWITVFDFSEISKNVELGHFCVTWESILKSSSNIYPLKHHTMEAYGSVKLEFEVQPFSHYDDDKTVFEAARHDLEESSRSLRRKAVLKASKNIVDDDDEPRDEGDETPSRGIKARRSSVFEAALSGVHSLNRSTHSPFKSRLSSPSDIEESRRYKLRIDDLRIRHAFDLRSDCQLWVECVLKDPSGGDTLRTSTRPALWTRADAGVDGGFDIPFGAFLKPIRNVEESYLEFKLWRKFDLTRSCLGRARFYLRKMKIFEEDETTKRRTFLTVLRTPTLKKSVQRKVAELGARCVLIPISESEESESEESDSCVPPVLASSGSAGDVRYPVAPGEVVLEEELASLKSAEGESDLPWPDAEEHLPLSIVQKRIVNVSAERAGAVILSRNSDFFPRLAEKMGYIEFTFSAWRIDDETGALTRTINYYLRNAIVGKVKVTQTQRVLSLAAEGFRYKTRTSVPGAPFGSRFASVNIVSFRRVAPKKCELRVDATVEWTDDKKPNVFLANRIIAASSNGMTAAFDAFVKILDLFLDKQTRRNSREDLSSLLADDINEDDDLDQLTKRAQALEVSRVDVDLELAFAALLDRRLWAAFVVVLVAGFAVLYLQ